MTTLTERSHTQSPSDCRVSFRQPVDRTGSIDAGWWPRSNDLAAELPALLEVLWTAGRDITRITYNIDSWAVAPRRMQIEGNRIRVAGYHQQNPLVITIADARHNDTVDLLIIPFATDSAVAGRLLELAAESGNTHTPEQMMELAGS